MRVCISCGEEIPAARLKAVPNTRTCVLHSTAERFSVHVAQHGDLEDDGYQEFEIIRDPEVFNRLHEYKNQLGTYK